MHGDVLRFLLVLLAVELNPSRTGWFSLGSHGEQAVLVSSADRFPQAGGKTNLNPRP